MASRISAITRDAGLSGLETVILQHIYFPESCPVLEENSPPPRTEVPLDAHLFLCLGLTSLYTLNYLFFSWIPNINYVLLPPSGNLQWVVIDGNLYAFTITIDWCLGRMEMWSETAASQCDLKNNNNDVFPVFTFAVLSVSLQTIAFFCAPVFLTVCTAELCVVKSIRSLIWMVKTCVLKCQTACVAVTV